MAFEGADMPPKARASTTANTSTNASPTPLLEIKSTETVTQMVEALQQHFMVISQYLSIMAVKLDFRIVGQLRKEGMDTSGRLSFLLGTTAQRAADQVTNPLNHASDALAEAAAAVVLFGTRWAQNVAEPIAAARNRMSENEEDYLQV